MKKNNIQKKAKMSVGKKMAIGAGLVAIGAGAYYLLGPNAKAHQKKTLALLTKIKKEVESEMKKAKNSTATAYHKTVDSISSNYAKQYKAHEKEIKAFAKKLKDEKKAMGQLANKTIKKVSKSLKGKKA